MVAFFVVDISFIMEGGRDEAMGGTRTTPEGRTTDTVAADVKEDEEEKEDAAAVVRTGPVGEKGLSGGGPAAAVVAARSSPPPPFLSCMPRLPAGNISEMRRS